MKAKLITIKHLMGAIKKNRISREVKCIVALNYKSKFAQSLLIAIFDIYKTSKLNSYLKNLFYGSYLLSFAYQ